MNSPGQSSGEIDRVSVLIVAYKCPEPVRACLESLLHLRYASFDIHILENGGPRHYEELKHSLSDLIVFESTAVASSESIDREIEKGSFRARNIDISLYRSARNLGFAGGVNAMLRSIETADWTAVWILNPDTRVDPFSLSALVEHSRKNNMGIVGSRLLLSGTGRVQLYGGGWRPWIARGLAIGLGSPADFKPDVNEVERQLDFVSGASMLVSRAYVRSVGLMDENYFLYYEEMDWCFRKKNFRLGYAHDSIVYHDHGATTGASTSRRSMSPLTVFLDERNKLLFSRRFFPKRFPVVMLICLVFTTRYLAAGAPRNFMFAMRGWVAGVIGQWGPPVRMLETAKVS